jgi:hypothetical protein
MTNASQINGITEKGNHQFITGNGKGAADLLFIRKSDNQRVYDEAIYQPAHTLWETKYSGRKTIVFKSGKKDIPHMELI